MGTSGQRVCRWGWALATLIAFGVLGAATTHAATTTRPTTTQATTAPSALAQPLILKTWRTTDGLPQNTVTAMARTPDGYLWVGTYGGLARFDGVRFVNYGLAEGLRSLSIRALIEDGEGGLWIATLGGGLSRLRRDGAITTLTAADGLLHDDVNAIARAPDGTLWVGTPRGLQRWTADGGFVRVGEAEAVRLVHVLAVTAEGLWGSQQGRGLFLCRDGRVERIDDPVPRTKERALFASAFLVDAAGDLWVSMGNGVIARRHAGQWTELNKSDGVPFSVITCFAQGLDGSVWAGTNEAGVFRFRDGRFAPTPGTSPSVWALLVDWDGIAWAGTRADGLSRLIRPRVTAFPVGNDAGRFVNGVAEAPDGSLWVATMSGLYQGPADHLERSDQFGSALLRATLRMSDGSIYISGKDRLSRYDPKTGSLRSWSPGSIDMRNLCEGANGTLWVGTAGGNLLRLADGALEAVPGGDVGQLIAGAGAWSGQRGLDRHPRRGPLSLGRRQGRTLDDRARPADRPPAGAAPRCRRRYALDRNRRRRPRMARSRRQAGKRNRHPPGTRRRHRIANPR